VVIHGPDLRALVATWTELTGRPPLPPRWALGLLATGYPQEPQAVVVARAAEHRRRRLPLDAIVLDYHWEVRFHDFRWRRSLFPDPEALLSQLASLGIRLGLIVTPFANRKRRPFQRWLLRRLAANVPPGCERDDERALPEYEEGLARGYFAHPDARWWFGRGGMVDFTHPEAAAWFVGRMRALYAQGVAFFKNDDGEYLPADATSALGISGREHHNLYGFFYGRALYRGMEELDDRRGFVYARSVWVGSQRFPALFLGDQRPTFRHMRQSLRAGLNLSLLGFAHWTADVFGLDGKTTPETHRRYAQFALFAPIARTFWRPPAIDDTRFPWSHGPENERSFRTHVELRYRLLPYLYALAWEAWRTGLPVLRPMLLEFDDPRFADVDDQFLLGDRLLLAPILEARRAGRRIALPPGTWHDFWSAHSFTGGSDLDYSDPGDRLPLLVRGGTVLPLGPPLEHVADGHRFDRLELHAFPPWPAECTLYDDDGISRAYQRGEFATTRIAILGDARRALVSIGADAGRYAGQPAVREVEVFLHRTPPPRSVRLDGAPWGEWAHDAEAGCVRVRAACPTARATHLEIVF
jgi:alpha-glucosidase (family GH31 glycosyl hydrolase)